MKSQKNTIHAFANISKSQRTKLILALITTFRRFRACIQSDSELAATLFEVGAICL